ncbi:hypothetical protein BaRGS_00003978 [Batillaria attramentaria]|uniref:Uncharacterized protein n=1 Tax=Batillaria attramentaria TaxID=370345 RepID=A0ABD0LZC4_9CAEN
MGRPRLTDKTPDLSYGGISRLNSFSKLVRRTTSGFIQSVSVSSSVLHFFKKGTVLGSLTKYYDLRNSALTADQ